MFTLAPESPKY